MKPISFDYRACTMLDEALAALPAAKAVAGGQSLGPMLNLRLARPACLLDLSMLTPLKTIEAQDDGWVRIGAAVTHARIEDGEGPIGMPAMLRSVAGGIAYRAVRNRGTIGGSLAHADPAADWVSTLTAIGARIEVVASRGASETTSRRLVAMEHFMLGAYRTNLAPGELITAIHVPAWHGPQCWGYHKICRKVGEFADAIGAVVVDPTRSFARVVAGATEARPLVLDELGQELARTAAPLADVMIAEAIGAALPQADNVKRHLLLVAVKRAVSQVLAP